MRIIVHVKCNQITYPTFVRQYDLGLEVFDIGAWLSLPPTPIKLPSNLGDNDAEGLKA